MIDKSKTYRTRDGREVRIYATDGGLHKSMVHGAIFTDGCGWLSNTWSAKGSSRPLTEEFDLIEVRPRHKRTVWVTVYPMNRYQISDENIQCDIYPPKRIACLRVELDFEDGEGL